MRRRLLIIILILAIALSIFVATGASGLSSSESQVSNKFEKMRPELNSRYLKLNDALMLAEKIGAERDVTKDGLASYKLYTNSINKKNISGQLKYARELEDIIGRLRANAASSVKLSGSQELKDAIEKVDASSISKESKDAYKKSANSYEDKRTSWRYLLSATILGYSSKDIIEFSEPSK